MSNEAGTLGYLRDEGYKLSYYCGTYGCPNHDDVNLDSFCRWLGPDHGAQHADLEPLYHCPECGGRKVSFILSPASRGVGVSTPSNMPDLTGRRT